MIIKKMDFLLKLVQAMVYIFLIHIYTYIIDVQVEFAPAPVMHNVNNNDVFQVFFHGAPAEVAYSKFYYILYI